MSDTVQLPERPVSRSISPDRTPLEDVLAGRPHVERIEVTS